MNAVRVTLRTLPPTLGFLATASRVIRGEQNVSAKNESGSKGRGGAGYRPNSAARTLVTRRAGVVAIRFLSLIVAFF